MKVCNRHTSGFTLIELLVVIAIIGLLASVVLLALNSARAKSRDAKRLADVRQLASAMELYFNDKNTYPTTGSAFAVATGKLFSNANVPGLVPNYIGLIPSAPQPGDGVCTGTAFTQNAYDYMFWDNGSAVTTNYTIGFCLGAATGGYAQGFHDLTPAGIQ